MKEEEQRKEQEKKKKLMPDPALSRRGAVFLTYSEE